jgi:hypothetical protein
MEWQEDLGSFGDERLKKGGVIFSGRWSKSRQRACASWEVAGQVKFGMGVFCAIRR